MKSGKGCNTQSLVGKVVHIVGVDARIVGKITRKPGKEENSHPADRGKLI